MDPPSAGRRRAPGRSPRRVWTMDTGTASRIGGGRRDPPGRNFAGRIGHHWPAVPQAGAAQFTACASWCANLLPRFGTPVGESPIWSKIRLAHRLVRQPAASEKSAAGVVRGFPSERARFGRLDCAVRRRLTTSRLILECALRLPSENLDSAKVPPDDATHTHTPSRPHRPSILRMDTPHLRVGARSALRPRRGRRAAAPGRIGSLLRASDCSTSLHLPPSQRFKNRSGLYLHRACRSSSSRTTGRTRRACRRRRRRAGPRRGAPGRHASGGIPK